MRVRSRAGIIAAILVALLAFAAAFGLVREVVQKQQETQIQAARLTAGDPRNGVGLISYYGCGACHQIPGIAGARGRVGPSLKGIASRTVIAGKFTNTPGNLIAWVQHPQQMDPGVDMPEMGVTEQEARDIAAYLYTLQ